MELTVSVLVLTLTFFALANAMFERKTIRIDRFLGVCPGYKNSTMQIRDIRLKNDKRYFSISLKIHVLKDISSDIKYKVVIDRCRSKEALDTCEPYPDVQFSQICAVINSNMPPFKSSMEQIHPKLTCPFKKGVYEMSNGTVDQTSLSMFPLTGWYLKTYGFLMEKIENEYKTIFCTYMEGTIIPVA